MIFISKKIPFIAIFLFIFILPVNSFAIESQCVKTSLKKIEDSNKSLLKSSDEESINKIINEKDALISNLFQCIKENSNDIIDTNTFSDRTRFLKTRIDTNRSLNNILAVERDQTEINTIKIRIRLAEFISFLIRSHSTYSGKNKIIDKSKTELSDLEKLTVEKPDPAGSGKIATELKEKICEFRVLSATYSDILHFTMEKITSILTKTYLHYIHIDTSIDTINALEPMRNVNRIIRPTGLDMGRLVLFTIILVLISLLYPLFSRVCDLIAKFIEKRTNISTQVEIFYTEINKPLKTLILFLGINIALTTISYKTDWAENVVTISYCVYSMLYFYLFFNFIDAVAIIQLEKYESRQLRNEIINVFIKMGKFIVFVTGIAITLNHFGIEMTAILSTLGIGGLAFALAAKDTLSNLFGGITILMDDIFRQGDWIIIQGVEGTVVEVGVRSTSVRTFENSLVSVPNSTIANFQVVNWTKRTVGRRIKMHIGVTYESSMQDIKNAVEDIRYMLEKHPDLSKPKSKGYSSSRSKKYSAKLVSQYDSEGIKNKQMVYFDKYNDYSMDILIYCFSKSTNWAEWLKVKEDLLYKIHEILTNNNLEFAYPTAIRINRQHTQVE